MTTASDPTGPPAVALESTIIKDDDGNGGRISRRLIEIAVALLLIGLAGMALWDSYGRGAGWENGPQSGFFPARVGWLALAASLIVLVGAFRQPDSTFATWSQLRQVARVFLPFLAFVAAIRYLGVYVSSGLFLAFFMATIGAVRWWWIIVATVAVPAFLFWVFEIKFVVLLPKGPLEAFFGY